MSEPSRTAARGSAQTNAAFRDPAAYEYAPHGTRSDTSEAVSGARGSFAEVPVDVGIRRELGAGEAARGPDVAGGATFDPSSQMTAQARWGSRRDADEAEARRLPVAEGPVVKGNASAVEDARQEAGFLEGQLGTVARQTRNA
ncbi:hypothetical protein AcV7_003033 [Taiwanofungus camphoratus]|nr:hypothetical protein AcV7_003033 [Antrodia cinnamomea]